MVSSPMQALGSLLTFEQRLNTGWEVGGPLVHTDGAQLGPLMKAAHEQVPCDDPCGLPDQQIPFC
jgi:hypothetical protein